MFCAAVGNDRENSDQMLGGENRSKTNKIWEDPNLVGRF